MAQPSIFTASIAWIDSANDVQECWRRLTPMIGPLQRRSGCNVHFILDGACNANVCIVRDPSETLFDSVQSVIYRPAGDEGALREERSMPGMQWVGRVKSVVFDVEGKPGQPPCVRIWSDASGTHARFSHGFWHYTLDGDRLVKRDVRRALRIYGAICCRSALCFLAIEIALSIISVVMYVTKPRRSPSSKFLRYDSRRSTSPAIAKAAK